MQAILRNPLADPYLLSTSSGAGLGIVLIFFLGLPALFLPGAAFVGALLSTFLVYLLAQKDGKLSAIQLILSGVIISIALSGLTIFLASISTNPAVPGTLWWMLGSLQSVDSTLLMIVTAMVLGGIGLLWFFAQDLNAITLGEEAALHLGVEVETLKRIILVLITLITGAVVALSGVIGFVGLIIPHAIRKLTGPNHKLLLPVSALAAGAFLVGCDCVGRILMPPIEIPIGIITALVGAPVFLGLLKWKA
jgi:iron complex transport system permease protein